MLPGFRFLFAAILLSVSVLVFGVGAAALLRATHEQFVSAPSWRSGPQEQVFAQLSEPAEPTLTAFRAEPEAPSPPPSLRDQVPTIALPVSEAEQGVALQPEPAPETEPARVEASVATQEAETREAPARQVEPDPAEPPAAAIAAPADAPAPPALAVASTAAASETTIITTEAARPAATPVAPEPQLTAPAAVPAPSAADVPAAITAALTDPAGKGPPAEAKAAAGGAPDKATKRRAHRQKKRHRVAQRAPAAPLVQSTFDPFGQQQLQTTLAPATRTR